MLGPARRCPGAEPRLGGDAPLRPPWTRVRGSSWMRQRRGHCCPRATPFVRCLDCGCRGVPWPHPRLSTMANPRAGARMCWGGVTAASRPLGRPRCPPRTPAHHQGHIRFLASGQDLCRGSRARGAVGPGRPVEQGTHTAQVTGSSASPAQWVLGGGSGPLSRGHLAGFRPWGAGGPGQVGRALPPPLCLQPGQGVRVDLDRKPMGTGPGCRSCRWLWKAAVLGPPSPRCVSAAPPTWGRVWEARAPPSRAWHPRGPHPQVMRWWGPCPMQRSRPVRTGAGCGRPPPPLPGGASPSGCQPRPGPRPTP